MISIIVPYRDRILHKLILLEALRKIEDEIEVIIVEQDGSTAFNRAKLLNIGAIFARGSHFVFHDVDMIPTFRRYPVINYFNSNADISPDVYQLASSSIQKTDYLGGVTSFERYKFFDVGGYSNNFFSRAEDNEMMFNLKRQKISVKYNPLQFIRLNHLRNGPEFDEALWVKAQLPRAADDGIEHCNFSLVSAIDIPGHNGRNYLVSI